MDDVLFNKVEVIERCLLRIHEGYDGHESQLNDEFMRQDSIILNLQRACEASIDAAMHVVRVKKLGIPQKSRDAFCMMETHGLLSPELSTSMQAMVGFRNIAVHNYQAVNLDVVVSILNHRLGDFRAFTRCLIIINE